MDIVQHDNDIRTLSAAGLFGLGFMLLFGLSSFWPLLILLPGMVFLSAYRSGSKSSGPLAVPGMLISGTGALLLFQSLTGYWESWAYAWTLYGVFLGAGLIMMGERQGDRTLTKIGRYFVFFGGAGFVGLGSLFVMMTSSLMRYLLVLILFAAGWNLLKSERPRSKKKRVLI